MAPFENIFDMPLDAEKLLQMMSNVYTDFHATFIVKLRGEVDGITGWIVPWV